MPALAIGLSLPRRPLNRLLPSRKMSRGFLLSLELWAAPAPVAARFLSQGFPLSRAAPLRRPCPASRPIRAPAPSARGFFSFSGPNPARAITTRSYSNAIVTGVNRASIFAGIRTSDDGPARRRHDHHEGAVASLRFFSSSSSSTSSALLDPVWNPTEEHRALRKMVRSFVDKEIEPQANEYNSQEKFNLPLFRQLGDLGLFGLTVPDEYGGVGTSWTKDGAATAVVIAHEELASSDPAFCLSYLAHSLLLVNNLCVNSTECQKERFLPALLSGEKVGGMGMSESGAGTDVLAMKTAAVRDPSSPEECWILSGSKMWITNGCVDDDLPTPTPGDTFLVYARTGPGKADITSFVVEKGMDGFGVGQKIRGKLGMRASPTAEILFDNVRVPSETHVIGQINGATLCMMRNLEIERLGLAAMALGIARRCLNEMKSYASQRTAFGHRDLYGFGQIQRMVAESYAEYMAGRTYVYGVARHLDLNKHGNGLDADGTKLFCAKMAKAVADRAIQVLGGNGYTEEYKVERLWRDAKLVEIGGGTNESHHKNMCRDLRKTGSIPIE